MTNLHILMILGLASTLMMIFLDKFHNSGGSMTLLNIIVISLVLVVCIPGMATFVFGAVGVIIGFVVLGLITAVLLFGTIGAIYTVL